MRGMCALRCLNLTFRHRSDPSLLTTPTLLNTGPSNSYSAQASTSTADCYCETSYYDKLWESDDVECVLCTLGANCTKSKLTLASLPLKTGYYRTSTNSSDLRQCADYADGSSGCIGGVSDGEGPCKEWLAGPLCSLCNVTDSSRYYDAGESACLECSGSLAATLLTGFGVIIACAGAALLWWRIKPHRTVPRLAWLWLRLKRLWRQLSLRPKCKQLLGFYQV